MGDDLEVLTFLMGVEIERLFDENIKLRSNIETLENQALDRRRYDEHINELTDKLQLGETRFRTSISEVERLRIEIQDWEKRYSLVLNEKQKEIDLYKQRLSDFESNRNRDLSEYSSRIRALEV
jgi:hypothetical protein